MVINALKEIYKTHLIMKLLEQDLYINCDELIKEANILYEIAKNKQLLEQDKYYIDDMNHYINKYVLFKEHQIRQYITDLNEYIEKL